LLPFGAAEKSSVPHRIEGPQPILTMEIRDTTRIAGLIGNPVSHSLSPAMHNAGFARLGIDARYEAWPVTHDELPAFVEKLRDPKYLGANVTLPHKEGAFSLVDERSAISEMMGVVNTIVNRNGKLFGDTTDPVGFLRNFLEAGQSFDGKSTVILGNGGSARTIAFTLSTMAKPKQVVIAARNVSKSSLLVDEILQKTGKNVAVVGIDEFGHHPANKLSEFDIIVNTTPVGMHPSASTPLLKSWLRPHHVVYDIVYNPEETTLLRDAKSTGCAVVGGLGMLIHQGLASFEQWTGKNPGADVFLEGIRRHQHAAALAATQATA
jgi:shikimate dehydrogenase